MINNAINRPLRICILSYRSKPCCGGQGVYVRNLAKSISDIGHHVDIISGPPDFAMDCDNVNVYRMSSLDLYNPENLFRKPTLKELHNPINMLEWMSVSTMGFPEPFIFGIRAKLFLKDSLNKYDIIHDNQSLSYGVLSISKKIPTIATIHHPITKDRDIAINSSNSFLEKLRYFRWYSFIGMQKRVSRALPNIITVSQSSKKDISEEFNIPENRLRVVPNGINTEIFHPIKGIKKQDYRVMVTTSSDMPIKGLKYLLKAIAHLSANYKKVRLFIVGEPKIGRSSLKLISQLGIRHSIKFTGQISDSELVIQYAKASVTVIPSIYEGFGLPAGEAMACGTPVISTTGGALPEVVGNAGILVPPKDHLSLSHAIAKVFDNPTLANTMSEAGFERVQKKFSWKNAAEETVEIYKEVLA